MRCNDCNKFVAFDEDVEPEMDGGEASDGTYRNTVTRVLNCEQCGTELKRGEFQLEVDFASDLSEADAKCPGNANDPEDDTDNADHEWTVKDEEPENNDRLNNKTRTGKTITNSRYMTQMRGVKVHVVVECERCGQQHEFDAEDEMAASAMDEFQ